jgi:protein-L-isoaspartate(D-aspartate) O-methyltransferase
VLDETGVHDARQFTQGQVVQSDSELAKFIVGLRSAGIRRSGLISAFEEVPRHDFLPGSLRAHSYAAFSLPIACGQSATPPGVIARLLAELDPTGSDRILEIGTGTGYQAALLSRMCRSVVTVERWGPLVQLARASFDRRRIRNVELRHGDGLDLPDDASFDAILVNGFLPENVACLTRLLRPQGRILMPVADGPGDVMRLFRWNGAELAIVPGFSVVLPQGLISPLRNGVSKGL